MHPIRSQMERQLTEDAMEENMTEDTMAEYLETDCKFSDQDLRCSLLTLFILCCGWVLPSIFRELNEDAKIPGYGWFFYAVFQVFGIGIWINIVFASIQYCNSRRMIGNALFKFLCLHLVPCIAVFGYYCVTELYIYKDSLIYIIKYLK